MKDFSLSFLIKVTLSNSTEKKETPTSKLLIFSSIQQGPNKINMISKQIQNQINTEKRGEIPTTRVRVDLSMIFKW